MSLLNTSGNVTSDAYGGGKAVVPNYIEECFSTWLYQGNGSTQTITNGIDLAGKGGMVWIKQRDTAGNHLLMTTDGGPTKRLRSNGQPSYVTSSAGSDFSSFNSNGFSLGVNQQSDINTSAQTYVSWSLRKQSKFFDVVTWTGNGANRTIAHNLGSVPGCIMVASTTALGTDWTVYHSSLANTEYLTLNSTAAKGTDATYWNSTTATSSVFSLGTNIAVNYNSGSFIAYLFAHNAGGFGLNGTDNVISCGSFTGNTTVELGYEPQWVLVKNYAGADSWTIMDNMRGMPVTGYSQALLRPNTPGAEGSGAGVFPTATGFTTTAYAGLDCIYIAIRRGPMKVPTSGTSVFYPSVATGSGTAVTTGFPVDLNMAAYRASDSGNFNFVDRLRGNPQTSTDTANNKWLISSSTVAETTTTVITYQWWNTGYNIGPYGETLFYSLRRAPSFFDEVCWSGNGTYSARNHNLGVTPELIISKARTSTASGPQWDVWQPSSTYVGTLNNSNAFFNNGVSPSTATTFTPISDTSGVNYVSYLFATCAGVSKVGSYTGTGTTQQINCGFTAGARFVMVKATSATGNWVVVDTARGMVAGTDPYLNLNTTAAEVNANNIYTTTGGFQLVSSDANTNANGTQYLYLAIA